MSDASRAEWVDVAARFGVDMEQVRRDHLISHVLAALGSLSTDDLVFIGGTALSRTHLADARLSEDVDLVALAPRTTVAGQIERAVRRGLARSHGRVSWRPALSSTRDSAPAVLEVDGTLGIQVQLLPGAGYLWPTEVRDLEQRYSDAPAARLRTPTAAGAAAAKLTAWMDRRAPRDLYDLWALVERGHVDAEALRIFVRKGPTGRPPGEWVFEAGPTPEEWRLALGHQTRLRVTASDALRSVRAAWARAASTPPTA